MGQVLGKNTTKRLSLILTLVILLPLGFFSHEAKAETLGPLVDRSEELNVIDVLELHSPQNITYPTSEILLNFTLIYEGIDHDVGYNIDGGAIVRINITKILEEPIPQIFLPPWVRVTCIGTIVLRDLSDGNHTVTVYDGYQYGGTNARFEVFKRTSVSFEVSTRAQIPEFPSWIILPLFFAATFLVIVFRKRLLHQSS